MNKIRGVHLMVDGYVKHGPALDHANIIDMLDMLVTTLGMQYFTTPHAAEADLDDHKTNGKDEGGISFLYQITTGHISIHVWPLRQAVMLDIFSCVPFDVKEAFLVIDKYLALEYYSVHTIRRQDPKSFRCDGRRQTGDWEIGRKHTDELLQTP